MAQRGRNSSAALQLPGVVPGRRLAAPADLTPNQRAVWERVVRCRPADWFDAATRDLLACYCRHAVEVSRLSAQIEALAPDATSSANRLVFYERLLALRAREGRELVNTARQLRLTPQSLLRAD